MKQVAFENEIMSYFTISDLVQVKVNKNHVLYEYENNHFRETFNNIIIYNLYFSTGLDSSTLYICL
jgi:hypothetical protein